MEGQVSFRPWGLFRMLGNRWVYIIQDYGTSETTYTQLYELRANT